MCDYRAVAAALLREKQFSEFARPPNPRRRGVEFGGFGVELLGLGHVEEHEEAPVQEERALLQEDQVSSAVSFGLVDVVLEHLPTFVRTYVK